MSRFDDTFECVNDGAGPEAEGDELLRPRTADEEEEETLNIEEDINTVSVCVCVHNNNVFFLPMCVSYYFI